MKIQCHVLGLILCFGMSTLAFGQKATEEIKHGVVKIIKYDEQNPSGAVGAGFIVGSEGNNFYIATAFHNAASLGMSGRRILADSIVVEFPTYTQSGVRTVRAHFQGNYNEELDLTVLMAPLSFGTEFKKYQFKMSDKQEVSQGRGVVTVGYPPFRDGQAYTNDLNTAVKSDEVNQLEFTNNLITGGNSGGPLFLKSNYRLAGMVTKTQGATAVAVSIEAIKFYLDKWNVPTNHLTDPLATRSILCGACLLASAGTGYYFNDQAKDRLDIYQTYASDSAAERAVGKDRQTLYDEYRTQRNLRNITYGAGAVCVLYETAHQLGWIGKKRKNRQLDRAAGPGLGSSLRLLPAGFAGIQLTYVKTF